MNKIIKSKKKQFLHPLPCPFPATRFITRSVILISLQCVNQMEVVLHHYSICISVKVDVFSITVVGIFFEAILNL